MKTMKLLSLTLQHFKGVTHFSIELDGANVNIYGDNATGKTTIFDAFNWLLFDKDSTNKKDFQLKTVDEHNQEQHHLNHEVEGTFEYEGQRVTLKKAFREKWTKKRGSARDSFSGHTTDYFIDGVPAKKKEFQDKVNAMVDESIFKLLTSPSYFNEQLHWKDRRQTLLEIGGDVSNEDVFSENPGLQKLQERLTNRTIEDHKKVIGAKKKEINEELDRIPVRIDEKQRGIPDISQLNEASLNQEKQSLNEQLEAKQEEINRVRSGGEVTKKENELRTIDGKLMEIKQQHQADQYASINNQKNEHYQLQSKMQYTEYAMDTLQDRIQQNTEKATGLENEAAELRTKYSEVNQRAFTHEHDDNCPTCGQELPAEQIEEAHKKAEEQFNYQKAQELEKIATEGKQKATKAKEIRAEIDKQQANKDSKQQELTLLQSQLEESQATIDQAEAGVSDINDSQAYQEQLREKEKVQNEIQTIQQSYQATLEQLQREQQTLKGQLADVEQKISQLDQKAQADKRVNELEQQEQQLAEEYERLEEELFLAEEFIRTKVNMLEAKISDKFQYGRFKLFKENINGGLEETCDTLYQGVPYSGGLNNAARINVGLDIINTLSEHYAFEAPIFIDNREAVTNLINTNAQIISLIVSEADKSLRTESYQTQEAI